VGHPRRLKKKYSSPKHPWREERIKEEHELIKKYGLKNITEVWKAKFKLRQIRSQARALLAFTGKEAEKRRKTLIGSLIKLGLLKQDATLDEVLALKVTDILDRRLQTIVYKKGIATAINEARQMIAHRHIKIGGRTVNAPGYLVKLDEADKVSKV